MVGEIRDLETADMAVHAALTGHIVLSTLHTNDAAGAIPRLIDMGIEPFLIASSVNTIIAQRLARRICQHCKTELKVPKEVVLEIEKELKELPKELQSKLKGSSSSLNVYKGVGCNFCNQTGYKGRIGIFEILPVEGEIQDLVTKKSSAGEIQKTATKLGMTTMKQDGILKVLDGLITMEELWRVTSG
jgi:type IV pilus assembly protein PilB